MSFTQPQSPSSSVLPPATQLFLDSLKAGVKLQTPSGQPTVAAQMAQKAGITQPPQQPQQPGGVPPVSPEEGQKGLAGILDQLKQAQQSGPSVGIAQQAAATPQPQQAQPSQNMAEGGLTSLPITVGEFAEGGIIGFDNGGPTTIGSAISHALPSFSLPDEHPTETAYLAAHPDGNEPEPAPAIQLKPGTDPLQVIGKLFAALKATKDPAERASISAAIQQIPFRRDGGNLLSTPAPAPPAAPAPVAPIAPGSDQAVQYQMPSLSGIMADVNRASPAADTSRQEALAAEQEKFLRNRPDFGAIANATATKNLQDVQGMDEQQRFLGLMSASPLTANSASRVAAETSNFNNLIMQRNAAYRVAQDANTRADFAAKEGDFATFQKAQADITAAKQKTAEINAALAGHMYTGQAGITAADINAQRGMEVANIRAQAQVDSANNRADYAAKIAALTHPPGESSADVLNRAKYLSEQFNPMMLGSDAREAIAQVPNGPKLLDSLDRKLITPQEITTNPKAIAIIRQAKANLTSSLRGDTKWGDTKPVTDYSKVPGQDTFVYKKS